jgi:hypothetical protein
MHVHKKRSASVLTFAHSYTYTDTRKKPRVIVMMPTRKDLHPLITKKAMACLHALEQGNPKLEIKLFLFDRVVPR